jgi:hypothetical protein
LSTTKIARRGCAAPSTSCAGLVDDDTAVGKPPVKTVKRQNKAKKAKTATVKPIKANGGKPTLVQALQ